MGKKVPVKPGGNTEQIHQSPVLTPQQQLLYPIQQQQQQQQLPFLGSVQQAPQQSHQQPPLQGTPWSLPPSQPTQQLQLPQKSSLQDNFSNQHQSVYQHDSQHLGYIAQDGFPCQQNQPVLNFELTPEHQQHHHQQQQQQQQQQQVHHEQSFQQAQQQLQVQQAVTQEPPQCPYNQSLSTCQLPAYQQDNQPKGGSWGKGGGGSVSLSPAKMDWLLSFGDETSLSAITSLEPLNVKRQRVDPPVAAYPERSRFEGDCQFRVEIPGTGRKLLVNPDEGGEGRRINTEMGHMITLELTHTAESSAACFRFLLVYSKDAEASTSVVPCGNHRRVERPKHMLEVKVGEREARVEWQDDPHPSVLVTPTVLAPGRFTCQLAFLCRNSCLTRRDLTLLCQLEVGDRVVGREPFKVKVSACPRRDAGAPIRRSTVPPTPSPILTGNYPRPQPPVSDPV